MTSPRDTSPWAQQQIRTFVRNARASVGGLKGWHALGPFLRRALLEAYVAHVFASQLDDTVIRSADIRALYRAMLREDGLDDD